MKLLLLAFFLIMAVCDRPPAARLDTGAATAIDQPVSDVSPADAQKMISKAYSQFVDVRTPEEYAGGHAQRAVNIPLDSLPSELQRLEKQEPVYLICETGNRSRKAADVLKSAGFKEVVNVAGGTSAWKAAGLPMEFRPPHGVASPN